MREALLKILGDENRIITDNTGRLFGFTHVPDTRFKTVTTALRQQTVNIFENQPEKAAKGKIGFAILYSTNQVILADYTDQDPVSGIYNHKTVDLQEFLPKEE